METATIQLQLLLNVCDENTIDPLKLQSVKRFFGRREIVIMKCHHKRALKLTLIVAAVLYCVYFYFTEMQSKRCSLELPKELRYAFRPPEDCSFCEDVDRVPREKDLTPTHFTARYAYNGKPLIVEDATRNWTAITKFNYNYFRHVYANAQRKQKVLDCQFLPYKTGFKDLFQALDMPEERVALESGTQPWYFGWSNCNPETAEEFRRHYGRPYFLPETSENNAVDWFFIGTSGLGAHMHVDNVRLPSWQAQLAGSKRWLLVPPPECYFRCRRLDVTVQTGEMIVLDTNKWYHQTFVQPGHVSLTIGAEYD